MLSMFLVLFACLIYSLLLYFHVQGFGGGLDIRYTTGGLRINPTLNPVRIQNTKFVKNECIADQVRTSITVSQFNHTGLALFFVVDHRPPH
jgi:hypothetical protein